MSPIDDELRSALQGRAADVQPSPDPLAGIERRARRLRRNRAAAAVAGSALAVAAVAVAVPAVQDATAPGPDRGLVATAPPPTTPTAPAASPYALDPARPWAYRGTAVEQGTLDAFEREYGVARGASDVVLTPLYGEVYEPSRQTVVVFLARVDGTDRWAVMASGEAGPELQSDAVLDPGTTALAAALPGDETARLLVVAAPVVDRVEYAPDGRRFAALTSLADGVAVGPLEGDLTTDAYRVVAPDGSEVFRGPAPDTDAPSGTPANLLGWPARGVPDAALEERAAQGYARARGVARAGVSYRVLLTAGTDGGTAYTVLQAWTPGRPAQVFGWVETPGRAPEPVLRPLTDAGQPVVALLLTDQPGRTTDELVLVPTPLTGQVLYDGRPVQPAPGLDGVVLVEREKGATGDALVVLDGDGDTDAPLYDGPVEALLCGENGCG